MAEPARRRRVPLRAGLRDTRRPGLGRDAVLWVKRDVYPHGGLERGGRSGCERRHQYRPAVLSGLSVAVFRRSEVTIGTRGDLAGRIAWTREFNCLASNPSANAYGARKGHHETPVNTHCNLRNRERESAIPVDYSIARRAQRGALAGVARQRGRATPSGGRRCGSWSRRRLFHWDDFCALLLIQVNAPNRPQAGGYPPHTLLFLAASRPSIDISRDRRSAIFLPG